MSPLLSSLQNNMYTSSILPKIFVNQDHAPPSSSYIAIVFIHHFRMMFFQPFLLFLSTSSIALIPSLYPYLFQVQRCRRTAIIIISIHMQHLQSIHRQQTAQNAFLQPSPKHDGIVFLIHLEYIKYV